MNKRLHIGDIRAAWIRAAAFAPLYLFITFTQRELIRQSCASLGSSLLLLAAHPSAASSVIEPALLEYWIAAVVWCALAPAFALILLRRARGRRSGLTAAQWVLAGFAVTALCAPIIAPLPPLAQGGLAHTRFLPPLSRGVCAVRMPQTDAPNTAGFPERSAAEARAYLLRRTTDFSGMDESTVAPEGPSSSVVFLFGTDAVGRDIFSRVIYGSRYSIGIGSVVVLISVLFGSCIGMAAGYKGGAVDSVFMRTVDVLMSIPTLFLVLTLMAILGQSVAAMIIVLSATEWMGIARIVRGEVMHLRGREFISASRLLGTSSVGILRLHVFPNVRPAIVNTAVLQLGNIFLAEASLSFLGLGIMAPNPSWGNMIADSMGHGQASLAGGIFPGIALSALIVAVHLIGSTEH